MGGDVTPDEIRRARRKKRWSQNELARRAGVTRDRVSEAERGALPSIQGCGMRRAERDLERIQAALLGEEAPLQLTPQGRTLLIEKAGQRVEITLLEAMRIAAAAVEALEERAVTIAARPKPAAKPVPEPPQPRRNGAAIHLPWGG